MKEEEGRRKGGGEREGGGKEKGGRRREGRRYMEREMWSCVSTLMQALLTRVRTRE